MEAAPLGSAGTTNTTMRLLRRCWLSLCAALDAGRTAWDVSGHIDSRLRRQQLRLALLDRDHLQRIYQAGHDEAYREELHRRGLLH
jgi:hypothetical protein